MVNYDKLAAASNYFDGKLYHAMNEGLIDTAHSIQIGIRTSYNRENYPMEVLNAEWVNEHSSKQLIERIRHRVGDKKVYLSFDIDGLDPGCAPGTGTPVAGGISTSTALSAIRGMVGLKLIGMDVVEVSPPFDHAEITSLVGATLALEMLYVVAANKGGV